MISISRLWISARKDNKWDTFYYKNIREYEVPECNRAAILWSKIRGFLPCRVGHRVLCLSTFGQSPGCVRQNRRHWADFLVSLVAPLHRQYKTARTELVVICYWKQGRWQLRQRLRAVMFCLLVPRRGTHKSPKNVCGLRTHPGGCSKLGKTQMIRDVRRGMVRNTGFCD